MPSEPIACPWCDRSAADRDELRRHLLVDHRKSTLVEFVADELADSREERADDREAIPA